MNLIPAPALNPAMFHVAFIALCWICMSNEQPDEPKFNLNKAVAFALLATVGGGGWGTLTVQSLVEELRQIREDVSHVREAQQSQHLSTSTKVAELKAEVRGMRRDIDRLTIPGTDAPK